MSKLNQVLVIDPSSELHFRSHGNDSVTAELLLSNPSRQRVAFKMKVKSKASKNFTLRPNNGLLEPQDSALITVTLQDFTLDQLEPNKYKFLVQSYFAPNGKFNIEDLFKNAIASMIMDTKLIGQFDMCGIDQSNKLQMSYMHQNKKETIKSHSKPMLLHQNSVSLSSPDIQETSKQLPNFINVVTHIQENKKEIESYSEVPDLHSYSRYSSPIQRRNDYSSYMGLQSQPKSSNEVDTKTTQTSLKRSQKQDILEILNKNSYSETEKAKSDSEKRQLQDEKSFLQDQNFQFKEDVTQLQIEVAALQQENGDIRNKSVYLQNEMNAITKRNEYNQDEMRKYEEETIRLDKENKRLKEEVYKIHSEMSSFHQEHTLLKEANHQLSNEISSLHQENFVLNENSTESKKEIALRNQENEKLRDEMKKDKNELYSLKEESKKYKENIELFQEDNRSLYQESLKLKEDIVRLNTYINQKFQKVELNNSMKGESKQNEPQKRNQQQKWL